MVDAIVNFIGGPLLQALLHGSVFALGLFTAVVIDVKYPRLYDYLTVKVAKLLLKL